MKAYNSAKKASNPSHLEKSENNHSLEKARYFGAEKKKDN